MASRTTKILPFSAVLFLTLLHLTSVRTQQPPMSPTTPPEALLNAAETLSNSGYNAMSLTLQLILSDLTLSLQSSTTTSATHSHPSLTIFAPPDTAFTSSGQPSRSLLLHHFSPVSLSLSSLSSLPFSTKIPSLSPTNNHLFITSSPSDPRISINNIKVVNSPLYDDGSVVVLGIEDFFDLNFIPPNSTQTPQNPISQCVNLKPFSGFNDASEELKSRGYSIMATFLDLQLMGFVNFPSWPMKLTVFAPEDEVMIKFSGDFLRYSLLFMRHMFPCKLSWAELTEIENGTMFKDYLEGFSMKIERRDKEVLINGIEITFPDMYNNDWLVVHGIRDVMVLAMDVAEEGRELEQEEEKVAAAEEDQYMSDQESSAPDLNEF